jgi:putative glycosyltransferase
MMTGLAAAKGDLIYLIDSDLEESPEWAINFFERMRATNAEVIYGVQERRKGGHFERISGTLFWKLINVLSGLELPANIVTARLMTKRYVAALLQHKEREIFIGGLWFITGFKQTPITVQKLGTSESTYTFGKKISLLVNSVTSFSNTPLISIFYIGLFILFLSCLYIGLLVVNWWFFSKPLLGWTSVMASIWFLGGLTISIIGIIGIYLSKIFSETKQRPYTIVKDIYE